MRFQSTYVRNLPAWIMIVALAVIFAPFSIRRATAREDSMPPLTPDERQELRRVIGEMREFAE